MHSAPLTMEQIQKGSLEIVTKIAQLCQQLGLRYYLAYGTLIGAIRHQGFIPWDDDLDIMMCREDYLVLKEYFLTHREELAPLELLCPDTCPDYPYTLPRVSNSDYFIETENEKDCGLGLFVDIYPLDTVSSDPATYAKETRLSSVYASLCFLSTRLHYARGNTKSFLKRLIKFPAFLLAKLLGKKFFFRKLAKLAAAHAGEDSPYIGVVEWGTDGTKDIYPRTWFGDGIQVPYEGVMLNIPDQYDALLRQYYGDYMQLPPEEDRIAHHFYTAYKKEA